MKTMQLNFKATLDFSVIIVSDETITIAPIFKTEEDEA